jgi:hypothetical protein
LARSGEEEKKEVEKEIDCLSLNTGIDDIKSKNKKTA